MRTREKILLLQCPDAPGILADVSSCLFGLGVDIRDAAQYGDPDSGQFFVRMHIAVDESLDDVVLDGALDVVARRRHMLVRSWDLERKLRTLIAVSRESHCLNDLLHRWHGGQLPAEIVGVVSNHEHMRRLTEWYGLPYFHLPVTPETKPQQEQQLLHLVAEQKVELLVLARYMQILSAEACATLSGRCINIHHSFLPSFKGAKPYHKAYERGVKLIGATAHYVTTDLDDGPIIEQDVARVGHETSIEEMVELGREVESRVLARAVRWHLQHRVMISGQRTVIL